MLYSEADYLEPYVFYHSNVEARTKHPGGVVELQLKSGEIPPAEPGNFYMLWLPGFDEKPFMAGSDCPNFFINPAGHFTQLVTQKQIGNEVYLRGPFGSGFELPARDNAISFLYVDSLAGMVSLSFLASKLRYPPYVFIDGLSFEHRELAIDIFLRTPNCGLQVVKNLNHFLAACADGNADYVYSSSSQSDEPLLQKFSDTGESIVQTVRTDAYIACALGLCGRCTIEDSSATLLCVDGPCYKLQSLPSA